MTVSGHVDGHGTRSGTCHASQGMIAMASGEPPKPYAEDGQTLMGVPGILVAVAIGVTVPASWLAPSAVLPAGMIAMAFGAPPTLIGFPGLLVARAIGITVPDVST